MKNPYFHSLFGKTYKPYILCVGNYRNIVHRVYGFLFVQKGAINGRKQKIFLS